MVAQHSQDPSRENEGVLGMFRQDEFSRIFCAQEADAEPVLALGKGVVSTPIFDGHAWHLFEIMDRRPEIPFNMINKVMDKKALRELVDYAYRNLGPRRPSSSPTASRTSATAIPPKAGCRSASTT